MASRRSSKQYCALIPSCPKPKMAEMVKRREEKKRSRKNIQQHTHKKRKTQEASKEREK